VGGRGILWGIGTVDEKGKVRELRLAGTVGVLLEVWIAGGVCEGLELLEELLEKVFRVLGGCDRLFGILTGEGNNGGFGNVSELDKYCNGGYKDCWFEGNPNVVFWEFNRSVLGKVVVLSVGGCWGVV